MKSIAIIGASGHGKVVADIALANGFGLIEFYDDKWPEVTNIGIHLVIGRVSDVLNREFDYDHIVVAIGSSNVRGLIQNNLSKTSPALVHPKAYVGSDVKVGSGTVVMPGAIINSNATIGRGVIINSGAVVEHDCSVGDFSHISPNAALAGGVSVGKFSWIGIGASVIEMVRIGSYVTVGAGSVVTRDIKDKLTVVGSPATVLTK